MTSVAATAAASAAAPVPKPTGPGGPAELPQPRGPLSRAVLDALAAPHGPAAGRHLPAPGDSGEAGDPGEGAEWPGGGIDPFGEDLQLALHLCYELHYQGWRGVDPGWEWDPELLRLRGHLERTFLNGLRTSVPGGSDVTRELDALLVEPPGGSGVSRRLAESGEWWQMREFLVHRSVYHLKEADPHVWVVPRLRGAAKAALVAVEYDEFGAGREQRVHSRLFADLLDGAGLDSGYLHYLEDVPAPALAVVNMMSLFGLHRSLRGALVGHFAAAETTTAPSARRLAAALERMGAHEDCVFFYTEHVEADAVHEQVMRRDVVGGLLAGEPELAADVTLGIQATGLLEERLAGHLSDSWDRGVSSLRRPLAV
ncbi:iron-containing redox enzyme family protein [Streptomyces marispadix]|uniref:Iron-containing redox enzyme family protein n=1 Tax=Streptomyces marispadix TaxID=2922868 RepID=A0ABS9T3K6_9ACTN|nr:iron-containing redox enzyme family protein [Streptomyces marispadix]MCH6163114.1 iron-containing redox enzyme family protein [Streptomyces marispadix]